VAVEDDLDGGPADETLRFAIGSIADELDLSAKNAAAFRQKLAPSIVHTRKAGRGQFRPAHRSRPPAQWRHSRLSQGPGHHHQRPRIHSR
jgi:hypothetical protein